MGEYNFIDIKQGTVAYRPEVIYIDCRQESPVYWN